MNNVDFEVAKDLGSPPRGILIRRSYVIQSIEKKTPMQHNTSETMRRIDYSKKNQN